MKEKKFIGGKMAKEGKKGIITKVVIGATILLGLVGITYGTVPQVKETIDNVVDKIVDAVTVFQALEKLEAVQNVQYDEKTRTISFDENLKARGYLINYTHNGIGYSVNTDVAFAKISLNKLGKPKTGDVITFEIFALGDGVKTKISDSTIYEYTLQFQDEVNYELAAKYLDIFQKNLLGYFGNVKAKTIEFDGFNVVDNMLIIEGTGTSNAGRNINFEYKIDISKVSVDKSFESAHDFIELISFTNRNIKTGTLTAEYAVDYIDMTDLLKNGGAFDEYISQGYNIEVLKFENSRLLLENDVYYVLQDGVYRATHPNKETITFTQETKVAIDNSNIYTNVEEFLEDASNFGVVTVEDKVVFNANLNEHLTETVKALQTLTETKDVSQEFNK
jgi:sulfur transfer complex TusBCD TusB component (DsrH family)